MLYKVPYTKYSFDKPNIIDSEGYQIIRSRIKSDPNYKITRENYRELQIEMNKPKNYSEEYFQNIESEARRKYQEMGLHPEQLKIQVQLSTYFQRHNENMKKKAIGVDPEDTSHKQFSLTGRLFICSWVGVVLFYLLNRLTGWGMFGLLFGICLLSGCAFTLQYLFSGISFNRFSNDEKEFYNKLNLLVKEEDNYTEFMKKYVAL